jgi:hypothetical protein
MALPPTAAAAPACEAECHPARERGAAPRWYHDALTRTAHSEALIVRGTGHGVHRITHLRVNGGSAEVPVFAA